MSTSQPDIVLVLADDMGFSDMGCFGGEIETPHLDRLGRSGVRFTQFYNSPRCSPTAWDAVEDKEWQARRMEVYAAQLSRMDGGIGRLLDRLTELGRLDNTIVVFLSDNGGCAEELDRQFVEAFVPLQDTTKEGEPVVAGNVPGVAPGPESTYASYGRAWANLSNTPFREYKHRVHEGCISTPLLWHWPDGTVDPGRLERTPFQLVDVLPSLLEAAGAGYPSHRCGAAVPPIEGRSMLPTVRGEVVEERPLFWEHEGNQGVRHGRWKLVCKHGQEWELYDMVTDRTDRTELTDLSDREGVRVGEMSGAYDAWAKRCGVIPRDRVLQVYAARGKGLPPD